MRYVGSTRRISTAGLVLVVLHTTGCSVIGLATGAIIDGAKPDTTITESNYHRSLRTNRAITVVLDDGSRLNGEYEGVVSLGEGAYSARFEGSSLSPADSPRPGDEIRVLRDLGGEVRGIFLGYDLAPMRAAVMPGSKHVRGIPVICRLMESEHEESTQIHLSVVRAMIGPRDTDYDMTLIRERAASNDLPLLSALSVRTNSVVETIPIDEIAATEQPTSKKAKWVLLGVGAGIDATLAIWAVIDCERNGCGM